MRIKVKMDDKAIADTIQKKAEQAMRERVYDIECPHCKKAVRIMPGSHPCPLCGKTITLTLNIKR